MHFSRLTKTGGCGVMFLMVVFLAGGAGKNGAGPITDYRELNIDIRQFEGYQSQAGWIVLSAPNRTVNLLTLTGGVCGTLTGGNPIPLGQYTGMRFILGSENTIKLADGSVRGLTVPSETINLEVTLNATGDVRRDVLIDFSPHTSIYVHKTGNSDKYMLRPSILASETVLDGSITGRLTDAASGQCLAGVMVIVQTIDTFGQPVFVRSAVTRPDGSYRFDQMPFGTAFFITSQPVIGNILYEAKVGAEIILSAQAPITTCDLAFQAQPMRCVLMGEVLPPAEKNESDVIYLTQTLSTSQGLKTFIIRTELPIFAWGMETYLFTNVPMGTYQVLAIRTTVLPDGTITTTNVMTFPGLSVNQPAMTEDVKF